MTSGCAGRESAAGSDVSVRLNGRASLHDDPLGSDVAEQAIVDVPVGPRSFDRFGPLLGTEGLGELTELAARGVELLVGRVVWNVNSTAAGAG